MEPNFENRSLNTFFDNIRLRVEKNDGNALALIDICFDKISDFNHFHELCTGSTIRLGTSLRFLHEAGQISAGNFDGIHDWLPVNSQPPIRPIGALSTSARKGTPNLKRKRTEIDSNDSKTTTRKLMRGNEGCGALSSAIDNRSDHELFANTTSQCLSTATTNQNDDKSRPKPPSEPNGENTQATSVPLIDLDDGTDNNYVDFSDLDTIQQSHGPSSMCASLVGDDMYSDFMVGLQDFDGNEGIISAENSTTAKSKAARNVQKLATKNNKKSKNNEVKNSQNWLVKCRFGGNCKESFENSDAMMFHVADYHAKGIKRTFECHLCRKTMTQKRGLLRHMNSVHHREIRYECPITKCSKIFARPDHLKTHTNAVHTKKIAFKCSKCSKKFYRKHGLTGHLASKHGVGTTFSCHLCKRSVSSKRNLEVHMKSLHTGQPRVKCPFSMCSKSYTRKSQLKVHINAVHTKNNIHKCTECGLKFYRRTSLTKHTARTHGGGIAFNCD